MLYLEKCNQFIENERARTPLWPIKAGVKIVQLFNCHTQKNTQVKQHGVTSYYRLHNISVPLFIKPPAVNEIIQTSENGDLPKI